LRLSWRWVGAGDPIVRRARRFTSVAARNGFCFRGLIHDRLPAYGEISPHPVIPSADFVILRLTTAQENAGSAGILPAVAGHLAPDDVAGRMPALPFPWQRGISP